MLADVAELTGQRLGRSAGGLAQQLEERDAFARARSLERDAGLVLLEGADRRRNARRGEASIVDELAEGRGSRVVVGEMNEEKILEPSRRRSLDPGKRRREVTEQGIRLPGPDRIAHGRQCGPDRRLRPAPAGFDDRQVGGLVKQAQREQLAGKWLALSRLTVAIQPADDGPRDGGLERAWSHR